MHTAVNTTDANDFDVVQGIYDSLAGVWFLGDVHRSQVAFLPRVADIDSALVIGGGNGRFLLDFLERTAVKRVVYIEKSEKMLHRSRALLETRHPEWLSRVDFRVGTEESLTEADGRFSLIVANFLLSCFGEENCARMIARLDPWLAPGGRWYVTDFETPASGLLRLNARFWFKLIYTFFHVVSKIESTAPPRLDPGFEKVGLKVIAERRFHLDMIRAVLLTH